uniref:Calx-beta domain-containing protein n=1 Tax=Romanomermis culicivorax TaxID=13658 RepID=A0A915JGW7_ROMCU
MTANFTCNKGLLIPTYIEAPWSPSSRAILYFVVLLYSFVGIAILADVFMCAILRITSTTRKVRVSNRVARMDDNQARYETVLIWNPTVANLTLMALGSSAPEILLSLIELIGNDFKAGSLGPGTIVGSAAFNLMVISAVCIVVIPSDRIKRISNISVFYVTTLWSCFAYIWLIVILVLISKDEVEVWEGCLTLIFFFILVLMAYGADVKLWRSFKSLKNSLNSGRRSETGDIENRKNLTSKGFTPTVRTITLNIESKLYGACSGAKNVRKNRQLLKAKNKVSVKYVCEDISAQEGLDYLGSKGQVSFDQYEIEKFFDLDIIDDAQIEKDETFLVRLEEPTTNASLGSMTKAIVTIVNDDRTSVTSPNERINTCTRTIELSEELKVLSLRSSSRFTLMEKVFKENCDDLFPFMLMAKIDRLIPAILNSLKPGALSWKDQFVRALNVNGGDVYEATMTDYVCHLLSLPWKTLAAFVPPPGLLGGWLTFSAALFLIGLVTALVGDLASTFGCLVHLEDTITAITFVALGTSLPDTFASRVAAIQDKDADNAIGNVTGSNSVNVFIGLGLPWFIASFYWSWKNQKFMVSSAGLNFSVCLYTVCSFLTIALLLCRRHMKIFGRGELDKK